MSTRDDSYPGLVSDEYDDRVETAGSGGAILGVLMTLLIGCGLVFAAYKLGQRTTVDDPPLLTAGAGEAKMVPINEGGTPIANQDNDAYTMIDELRRTGTSDSTGEQDGIVVSDRLPDRALDPTGALAVTGIQEDALRIEELQLASSIDGEPSLTGNTVPDRTGDLELAGGAEVQVADSEAVLRAETAASAAQRAQAERDVASLGLPAVGTTAAPGANSGTGTAGVGTASIAAPVIPPLTRSPDTQVAVAAQPGSPPDALTGEEFGQGLVLFPMPRSKPDLAPRPSVTNRIANAGQPGLTAQQPSAAIATTRVPTVVPVPGQVLAPALQAQPIGVPVPVQPPGDAQVQLGAMPTGDLVRARWQQLRAQHPQLLGRLGLQVQPVRTAQGQNLFRLRAGPLRDARQAAQLCDQLRVRGVDCFVPAR